MALFDHEKTTGVSNVDGFEVVCMARQSWSSSRQTRPQVCLQRQRWAEAFLSPSPNLFPDLVRSVLHQDHLTMQGAIVTLKL